MPPAAVSERAGSELDLTVVVPARNAAAMLDECLSSIQRGRPRELIVVDGLSTDATREIASRHGARVLSDEGRGLPYARIHGARAATTPLVALVDADVVLPEGALAALLEEFERGAYTGLQAGLCSVAGPGYWGQALVDHHRTGRSRNWFGLVATIFDRAALLEYGFDASFLSGEDIELRWRLERAGARLGVSRRTIVSHRFGDTYEFARGQWLADGHGLGRMVVKHRRRAAWLLLLPLGAGVRGIALSLGRRQPRWVRYYAHYIAFNYAGMLGELHAAARGGEA
jgi:glycosyltransferase involved in cell wall biosynthesis